MDNYDKIPFKNNDIDYFGGKKKKIRNMRQEGQYVELSPGEQSTHLMFHKGKEVFPSVFPKDKNTKSHDPKDWLDLPNVEEAYAEAKKRGEVVKFATKRRAEKIGMGAWKQGEARKEAMQNYRAEKKAGNLYTQKKIYKNFKESLPSNLSQTNEKEYAMKRYWKDSGKPKDFNEAQNRDNPMFYEIYHPEENKYLFHSVSVSEKTGKFYKPKRHESTYKELEVYKNNPELQDFKDKTKLLSRGKYWKYKEKTNRELTNTKVSERVNKRTEKNIEKGIKLSKNANR